MQNNQTYTYTAYISFRNIPLDFAVAKTLQSQLESYKIPPSIRYGLKNQKIGKVYLDRQEIAIGANIGDATNKALEQSEWLIVICSPDLASSKWCLYEIEYFIKLGRRDHILPILVSGEPIESFPEPMRTIKKEDGSVEEVYLLAADIRAKSKRESISKLRNVKLKLIAQILDVNCDELYRKHKSRIIKSNFFIFTMSAMIIIVASTIVGWNLGYNRGFTEGQNHTMTVIENIEPTVEDNKATDDYGENESISKFEVDDKVFDSIIDLAKSLIAASAGIIPALISGHYLLAANKQKK